MNRKKQYKDLEKAKRTGTLQNFRYYRKTAFVYGRRSWTSAEDEIILRHEIPDIEISILIKRSQKAIVVRRSRLRKEMAI